jgi:hypothetical protein
MTQQFPRVAAFDKGDGKIRDGDVFQGDIETCVAIDLVKIGEGEVIGRALELQDIVSTEYGGDIFGNREGVRFFNDDDINFEGF